MVMFDFAAIFVSCEPFFGRDIEDISRKNGEAGGEKSSERGVSIYVNTPYIATWKSRGNPAVYFRPQMYIRVKNKQFQVVKSLSHSVNSYAGRGYAALGAPGKKQPPLSEKAGAVCKT